MSKSKVPNLDAIKIAVSRYIETEGCSCCASIQHPARRAALLRLLGFPRYKDGSGYSHELPKRLRKEVGGE